MVKVIRKIHKTRKTHRTRRIRGKKYRARGSDNSTEYIIYCFWTGATEMSENRKQAFENFKEESKATVILVKPDNLTTYLLPSAPLHPAFEYLTETHKADYLDPRIFKMGTRQITPKVKFA